MTLAMLAELSLMLMVLTWVLLTATLSELAKSDVTLTEYVPLIFASVEASVVS